MNTETVMNSDNINSELQALLGDLPLDGEDVKYEGIEEEDELSDLVLALGDDENENAVEEEDEEEEALGDLEIALNKAEIYGSQKAIVADPDAAPPEPKKTRRATSTGGTVRTPRNLSAVSDEFFVLEGDPSAVTDLAANRAAVEAKRPTQKKVAEKFENLFTSISVGKEPSRYVTIAFALLREKGAFSSADLVAAYRAPGARNATDGYDEGTARSQCGQIMNLFDTVKIAERMGQILTKNDSSLLFKRLDAIIPA